MTGIGGHHSPVFDNDTWLTPPEIVRALGHFDLDPCAAPEPRPWDCAKTNWTRQESGLTRRWNGRVWLNPPYGGPSIIRPWLARMADHQNGTALIFARTETDAFHKYIWEAAKSVMFLRGRLFFHRGDGARASSNAGAPSCLVAYSEYDDIRLREGGFTGHLVALR